MSEATKRISTTATLLRWRPDLSLRAKSLHLKFPRRCFAVMDAETIQTYIRENFKTVITAIFLSYENQAGKPELFARHSSKIPRVFG